MVNVNSDFVCEYAIWTISTALVGDFHVKNKNRDHVVHFVSLRIQ